jgi:hypothetical protein
MGSTCFGRSLNSDMGLPEQDVINKHNTRHLIVNEVERNGFIPFPEAKTA